MSDTKDTKEGKKGIGFKLLLGFLSLVIAAYVGVSIYYNWHFYPNTKVGEVDVSGMTISEAEEALKKEIASYVLTIRERGGAEETITGEQILMEPALGEEFEKELKSQWGVGFPVHFFQDTMISKRAVGYDVIRLSSAIKDLECNRQDKQKEPKDAYIAFVDERYHVVSEDPGSKLIFEKFEKTLTDAVSKMEETIDLEKEECYEKPEVLSDDEKLNLAADTANKYLEASITYDDGNKVLVCGAEEIKKMLSIKEDGSVKLLKKKINEFAALVDKTYSTMWRNRSFLTSYGKTVTVAGGDYGWKVDRKKEAKALKKAIKNQVVETREPIFARKAASHGDKDYGSSYVEINLTAQHLFLYDKGNKVFETDFVSGNTSRGNGTRLGTNSLKYKEKDAILRGDDYETPVSFWMPFDGNIGMHDATWRSRFGGVIYKTSGSHGCINLPLASAQTIFSYVKPGEAVVVYELPGTETAVDEPKEEKKDDKKDKDKKDKDKKDKDKKDKDKNDKDKKDKDKNDKDKKDEKKDSSNKVKG